MYIAVKEGLMTKIYKAVRNQDEITYDFDNPIGPKKINIGDPTLVGINN